MKLFADTRQAVTYIFVIIAMVIVVVSLMFSNKLVRELAQEERNKIEIWAEATQLLVVNDDNSDMSLILHILQSNTTIPVILHDIASDMFISNNIKLPAKDVDNFLRKKASAFASKHEPIILEELNQYLYYDDSYILKQLSLYPYIHLSIMFVFIALVFFALSSSLKAEQNRVWMGLSKETAHQLGTPISSLMAWIELMRIRDADNTLLNELEKDVGRLEMIAERFSKIGSASDVKRADIIMVLDNAVLYMQKRISNKVFIKTIYPDENVYAEINEPLFEWVIENIVKNATDAMAGEGEIIFELQKKSNKMILDISDTGKGIDKSMHKKIFSPGFTTKERGWGLGLSLAKRIISIYHNGRIYVKSSEMGQGTTFRIVIDLVK